MNDDVDRWMQVCITKGFGLVLPSGWFGRPFDNYHKIDEYSFDEHGLNVTFNDKTIQILGKSLQFRIEKLSEPVIEKLIVSGFDLVKFSFQYSGKRIKEKFEDGEVTFVGYFA